MLHVYYGADDFRIAEALAELRRSLAGDDLLETNTTVLAGRGLTAPVLTQHAAAAPFFGSTRLVIVEGLLYAAGNGRAVADAWREFVDALPGLPASNHLVLTDPTLRRRDQRDPSIGRSPLLRLLRQVPGADIKEFAGLRTWERNGRSEVGDWLAARATERGIAIEPDAINSLVALLGANLRALAQELDKLAAYTVASGGRAIAVDQVKLMTPLAREESVFEIVDAIVEGRAAQALRLVRRVLTDGSIAPGYLQVMVARQLRHLVRATELLEGRASEQEIADATGVRSGFPLTKLIRQARRTTRATVESNLRALEMADYSVKTGRFNDELALELVVCRLAASAAGTRR